MAGLSYGDGDKDNLPFHCLSTVPDLTGRIFLNASWEWESKN